MDSCRSGSAVQAVRDERLNPLSENAETMGEQLYLVAAQTCGEIKRELMVLVHARARALDPLDAQIDELRTNPPADKTAAEVQQLLSAPGVVRTSVQTAYDARADSVWALYLPTLTLVALGVARGEAVDPPPQSISDYRTLGAQLDACDRLSNVAMAPVDRRVSEDDLRSPRCPCCWPARRRHLGALPPTQPLPPEHPPCPASTCASVAPSRSPPPTASHPSRSTRAGRLPQGR